MYVRSIFMLMKVRLEQLYDINQQMIKMAFEAQELTQDEVDDLNKDMTLNRDISDFFGVTNVYLQGDELKTMYNSYNNLIELVNNSTKSTKGE